MRLEANDSVTVPFALGEITLRVSLRAAYQLERKFDGFANLVHQLSACSVSAASAVIKAGAPDQHDKLTRFLDDEDCAPLLPQLREIIPHLIRYVVLLAGSDEQADNNKPTGDPISFQQFYENLYRIGTGWLGWTPADTWEATPAEIIEAYKGRQDLLKAIFGSNEGGKTTIDASKGAPAELKHRLNAIGDLGITSIPRAS